MDGKADIENIILQYSQRGMTTLRAFMPGHYCMEAARHLLELDGKTILLTTGFYVHGAAETDGPPGTVCAALALKKLGFRPVIVTDEYCRDIFEDQGLEVRYVPLNAAKEEFSAILDELSPSALISIERCGANMDGLYANMRGVDISPHTAHIDDMFEIAGRRKLYTVGVGDGGNEIGMGNLAAIIREKLSLNPCVVHTSCLIIATTSNWGAYGLAAALSLLSGQMLLPRCSDLMSFLEKIASRGFVDGISGTARPTVDGFPSSREIEIIEDLRDVCRQQLAARFMAGMSTGL